jgi:hypothetical protein
LTRPATHHSGAAVDLFKRLKLFVAHRVIFLCIVWWRALDFGRKWRLLRLADDELLRNAATPVLSASLDTRQTEASVRNLLAEQSEARARRSGRCWRVEKK